MFKLHDNPQAGGGKEEERMEWGDKTQGISTYKPIATSTSMDWRYKPIHMALYEGHQN